MLERNCFKACNKLAKWSGVSVGVRAIGPVVIRLLEYDTLNNRLEDNHEYYTLQHRLILRSTLVFHCRDSIICPSSKSKISKL